MVLQNDVNSRPIQFTVNINNTINYNLAGPIISINAQHPNSTNTNTIIRENNAERQQQVDESQTNESENEETTGDETSNEESTETSTSEDNDDENIEQCNYAKNTKDNQYL